MIFENLEQQQKYIRRLIILNKYTYNSMQVPPQLNFNQLQTKAFFSIYKPWPIQPVSNGGQYWPGQVIRIFFNALTQGVMDPYRSHIQITVQCDQSILPVGLLQVDNSAQSFIQQIVISSKNRQVQRIVQYGVLAAYLTDIGISQIYTQGKQVQGLGHSSIGNYTSLYSQTYSPSVVGLFNGQQSAVANNKVVSGQGSILPTMPTKYYTASSWGSQGTPASLLNGSIRSHISQLNTGWLAGQQQVWWWYQFASSNPAGPVCHDSARVANLSVYGYNTNIRAEYLSNHSSNQYIDTTSSLPRTQVRLKTSVQNNTFPAKFTNTTIYQTYIPDHIPYMNQHTPQDPTQNTFMCKIPNISSIMGFSTLYSPNFAKGARQPFISPTVPQCQLVDGMILPQKIPVAMRTFKIPLISAVLGLLIPQNQFILLPLRALNDVLIEMTIDNYAMFTSGYNDISQYDNVGMALMQQRAFKVTRLIYNLHTYQFYNPQLDQYLRVSLTTGIAINTKFWQMGNQYQIQNSQSLTNSWPVACNQQALSDILVLFYPLDYQNLSFCRKHFRISNNITKMQLRINMQYYPSQPLSGNGGNPVQVDSTGNNSIFLDQIYLANGYMFEKQTPIPRINIYNFAINQRCYNVYNTHTLYDPAMIDNSNYVWNGFSVNYDTAFGMANIHQNRYIGKAAYTFSFQPYSHSKNFLTGIDCRAAKSFDVIFTCNSNNWFPRPQVMFIYTCSSVIIQYGRDGIVNINK